MQRNHLVCPQQSINVQQITVGKCEALNTCLHRQTCTPCRRQWRGPSCCFRVWKKSELEPSYLPEWRAEEHRAAAPLGARTGCPDSNSPIIFVLNGGTRSNQKRKTGSICMFLNFETCKGRMRSSYSDDTSLNGWVKEGLTGGAEFDRKGEVGQLWAAQQEGQARGPELGGGLPFCLGSQQITKALWVSFSTTVNPEGGLYP